VKLPEPIKSGDVSLEKTILNRRTVRAFLPSTLTQEQFSQLLWAAQGVTDTIGLKRAVASAGALYPMDIYAVVGEQGVNGFGPGNYHYVPEKHSVTQVFEGDLRDALAKASLSQMWMAKAPLNLVITSEYSRICSKYGERGIRYAMIEAGHAGQNIFLQAEAMGLSAGIVGAFHDIAVIQVMGIPNSHEPLLIMPVGYRKS
jgi:SagB-type dehydrogenase family enzyme